MLTRKGRLSRGSLDKDYKQLMTPEGEEGVSLSDEFLIGYKYKEATQTRKTESEGCISIFVHVHMHIHITIINRATHLRVRKGRNGKS